MNEVGESALETPSTSWLVPFLLLSVRERDSYGHDLMRKVAELGFGAIRPGVVYRTLRQMEREGLILSGRDGLDCMLPWRRYSIAEPGEAYLEFWANSLAQYRKPLDLFLDVYAGEVRQDPGDPASDSLAARTTGRSRHGRKSRC